MLEEVKGRQAKMASIQSAMQSGDIKSGCVVMSVWRKPLNRMSCSISALLAGDEEPKTSGVKAQPVSSGASTHRRGGNKNKKR
jgi:hypothetical protein